VLRYLVAGQPPLLLRRPTGEVIELPLATHRLPLGAMAVGGYEELQVTLAPGDLVLGYSDGVTDARAPSGEFFGEDRLRRVVATTAAETPDQLVAAVRAAVEEFVAGAPLYDDVTLVAVGRDEGAARSST
jgi:sigma-B regulation protein RsbU (phosphoserine phosphatase)